MAKPPTTTEALKRCLSALQSRATDQALEAALEAWRASRDPALADLVDRLSDRLLTEVEAAAAAKGKNRLRRSVEAAAMGARTSLQSCWDLVGWKLPDADGPAEDPSDDPRLARALLRVLFERRLFQGWRSREEGYVERHAERLASLGDVRMAEPLETLLKSPNAFPGSAAEKRARPSYERALAELKSRRASLRPLPAPAAKLLEAIDALVPAAPAPAAPAKVAARFLSQSSGQALEAVFAAPDDDGLRRVCGDRLSEEGDPRGEFIALQFAELDGTATKEGRKRMSVLFNKNAGHWCSAVGPVGTRESMRFEKGFLAEITLEKSTLGLNREMWDAALESPYWATVVRLNLSERVPDWWLRAFLQSERSRNIRELAFRPKYVTKPAVLLSRSGPAAPLHLVAAVRSGDPKFEKALPAFSKEQLLTLADDAKKLKVTAKVADPIARALAKVK